MTKFPGGGLQFGEGPVDCLKREALEEFRQEIIITRHFYTTEFFQPTRFYQNMQLISIYYLFEFTNPINFKISKKPFDFEKGIEGSQSFRWVSISSIAEKDLTFPIDQYVLKLLKEKL
jgi:ADP-ribose pyrophosphatase YjhB (NUDIX family)